MKMTQSIATWGMQNGQKSGDGKRFMRMQLRAPPPSVRNYVHLGLSTFTGNLLHVYQKIYIWRKPVYSVRMGMRASAHCKKRRLHFF